MRKNEKTLCWAFMLGTCRKLETSRNVWLDFWNSNIPTLASALLCTEEVSMMDRLWWGDPMNWQTCGYVVRACFKFPLICAKKKPKTRSYRLQALANLYKPRQRLYSRVWIFDALLMFEKCLDSALNYRIDTTKKPGKEIIYNVWPLRLVFPEVITCGT